MQNLEKKLKEINGGNVLDVATGRGEFINFIKEFKNFKEITAIDASERAEKAFKEQFKDVEFQIMDAANMSYKDETFDTVCLSNSLHHMPDLDKTLNEMKRVLKKGGNFIINEMLSNQQNEARKSHVLLHHWWAKIDTIFGEKHDPTFSKDEIIAIIDALKFTDYDLIEYAWDIENPKEEKFVNGQLKVIEMGLERLKGKEEYSSLKTEAEKIKEHIITNGFAPASAVFIVG
ncbi:MAG: class I SAM-dependent methyltransferase, partial [Candidatus Cloacimonetes bacterium]|nr:class I SAM-dependent methyltransferase [Candidatus Cloacimonadota bacterium]